MLHSVLKFPRLCDEYRNLCKKRMEAEELRESHKTALAIL